MRKITLPHLHKMSFMHVQNCSVVSGTSFPNIPQCNQRPSTHENRYLQGRKSFSLNRAISHWEIQSRTELSPFLCFSYWVFGLQCDFIQDLDTGLGYFVSEESHLKRLSVADGCGNHSTFSNILNI